MGIKHKFLSWLERHDRKRVILDRQSNEPYLERYYLFLKDRDRFPFNVFLHRFLKSDPDDVHDHPWPYVTVILKGGYWEWTPEFDSTGKKINEIRHWCSPGHFRSCRATSYHRIELDPAVECWTLFMPGPQKREWGFLVTEKSQDRWIHNDEYLASRAQLRN